MKMCVNWVFISIGSPVATKRFATLPASAHALDLNIPIGMRGQDRIKVQKYKLSERGVTDKTWDREAAGGPRQRR